MVPEDSLRAGANGAAPPGRAAGAEDAAATLGYFLTTSPAALSAAQSLHDGAEVAVTFANSDGAWRVYWKNSGPVMEAGICHDADFALRLTPAAVATICGHGAVDIGDLGILFFEQIVARDPERRIRVQSNSGVIKLAKRGWLQLLARGGPKVAAWMARKGLRGPGAVMTALARLKKGTL